jgi:hypothetical protein
MKYPPCTFYKYFVLFILLEVVSLPSKSQLIFQKTFSAPGNQNAIAAMQSASDDYYILSETDSGQNNSKDFLLLKLDVSGNLIWSKYFGTTADDIPTDVKEMSNGKIMLCGYTYLNGATNTDILLINIDTAANVIWSKTYGGLQKDYGNKMAVTNDSSVVVAGQTFSYGIVTSSGYALKINSSGNIIWSVTSSQSGSSNAAFLSISNTFDGGYILTGYWQPTSAIFICSAEKIDAFGNVVASNGYPISGMSCKGYDVKAIPGGDFIIAGKIISSSDSGSAIVLRVNPVALSVSFLHSFTTTFFEKANSIVVTPDGNFALCGIGTFSNGSNMIEKGFLSKINLSGNIIYNENYQPPSAFTSLNHILVTNDSELLLSGRTTSTVDSSAHIYFLKVRLINGLSGCNQNSFTIPSNVVMSVISLSVNNNFGRASNSINVADSVANILQNDLCVVNVGIEQPDLNVVTELIHPNPSNGIFIINFNNNSSEKIIQIFDITGNIIYEKNKIKNSEEKINLTSASKGIYFLKVFDKDKTSVNKIVIQ